MRTPYVGAIAVFVITVVAATVILSMVFDSVALAVGPAVGIGIALAAGVVLAARDTGAPY